MEIIIKTLVFFMLAVTSFQHVTSREIRHKTLKAENIKETNSANQDCGVPAISPVFPTPNGLPPKLTFPHIPSKIVGGSPAKKGSYPWMVTLTWKTVVTCGGTLINNQWVLTGGQCVIGMKPAELTTGLGYYDVDGVGDDNTKQDIETEKIVIYDRYDDQKLVNDIALVKLAKPVSFTDYISPACLPDGPINDATQCDELPIVTGWGDTMGTSYNTTLLQQVRVPYVDTDQCNKWYQNQVVPGMFCLGLKEGGKDACMGDAGGPVVCKAQDNTYKVHGITSWGYGCAEAKHPGVYTDVHYYRDWIDQTISS